MSAIRVVPVGSVDPRLVERAARALTREYGTSCDVSRRTLDPSFAFHAERGQYHSTAILERLIAETSGERLLGVTAVDLFIPILTFVFGEAQLEGHCAVVSTFRLTEEFYGLPSDPSVLAERLEKEAIHEIGHTFGLVHCEDYECVMASAHSVEWLDLKGKRLCEACWRKVSE